MREKEAIGSKKFFVTFWPAFGLFGRGRRWAWHFFHPKFLTVGSSITNSHDSARNRTFLINEWYFWKLSMSHYIRSSNCISGKKLLREWMSIRWWKELCFCCCDYYLLSRRGGARGIANRVQTGRAKSYRLREIEKVAFGCVRVFSAFLLFAQARGTKLLLLHHISLYSRTEARKSSHMCVRPWRRMERESFQSSTIPEEDEENKSRKFRRKRNWTFFRLTWKGTRGMLNARTLTEEKVNFRR